MLVLSLKERSKLEEVLTSLVYHYLDALPLQKSILWYVLLGFP